MHALDHTRVVDMDMGGREVLSRSQQNVGGVRTRFSFQCPDCGEAHDGAPKVAYDRPAQCLEVPIHDRDVRIKLTEDLCRIAPAADDPVRRAQYFINATLDIPIRGADEPFSWGVWVTQSEYNFARYLDTFSEDQSGDGSFGWLAVVMPGYRRTAIGEELELLGCNVFWRDKGRRPSISLHECEHSLYRDQKSGMSWERAVELVRLLRHGA